MQTTTTLSLYGDVRIVVPDDLSLITPYVLQEQLDWFEDEIKFLRHLLQPGQKIIDIGANHGVYTLSMAQSIGATGHIWAFEPASNTADFLAASIESNSFTQVTLQRCALSSTPGSAQLSLHEHSELNALVHESSGQPSETVVLTTLDACLEKYNWRDIAFVKIDAEGEESNILLGGSKFFSELSPLVQYEVKAGNDLHLDLIEKFSGLGYNSYRLVPELNLLVPFDLDTEADGYLLNLFCCKADRAQDLAARGFLLLNKNANTNIDKLKRDPRYNWSNTLCKLPYGARLTEVWMKQPLLDNNNVVLDSLALYAISQDTSVSIQDRYHALETAFNQLFAKCQENPAYLRLSSLARIARAYGARIWAVEALSHLLDTTMQQQHVDPREPFLAPVSRFDTLPISTNEGDWVLASILEGLELQQYFSSFYSGKNSLQRLEIIQKLGYGSEEMKRRYQLVRKRFGLN